MRAGYGEKLRKYFVENTNPIKLIDFGGYQVFETATVDTNIIILQKVENKLSTFNLQACLINNDFNSSITISEYFQKNKTLLHKLTTKTWSIDSDEKQKIKMKIEKKGLSLKNWDIDIFFGIKTGFNEAFYVDEITKNALIAQDINNAEILKPILRGKDIKKYNIEYANKYILFIPWHFPLHENNSISGNSKLADDKFKNLYPAIYNHLLQFKKQLSERNKAETGLRYEWYALQRCANTYYNHFYREKIIYSEIVREPQFYYDTENYLIDATSFMITGYYLKYLIALLNSKPVTYFFKSFYAGGGLGETGIRYKKAFLENLPIPHISERAQAPFIKIVDEILEKKKNGIDTGDLERKIDEMVYELYELTAEEIKIVEGK